MTKQSEPTGNGWSKNEKFVLSRLDELSKSFDNLSEKVSDDVKNIYSKMSSIETTLTEIKVKQARLDEKSKIIAGTIGFLAGCVPLVIKYILKI